MMPRDNKRSIERFASFKYPPRGQRGYQPDPCTAPRVDQLKPPTGTSAVQAPAPAQPSNGQATQPADNAGVPSAPPA